MRYIAKDLNEIAAAFDKRADSAAKWMEQAKTAQDRRQAEVEARTWMEAADWLRATEIGK